MGFTMRKPGRCWRRAAGGLALLAGLLTVCSAPAAFGATTKHHSTARKGSPDSTAKVYRWVDSQGSVHFGDQVPPEYADTDREVLNQYGVTVRTEQGVLTPEELAAQEAAAAEKKAVIAAARRDEVLLSTYLSVEEIEALRNRRVELINGQILVTVNYLGSLREKLRNLQTEASAFKPYSKNPQAEPIDDRLAKELSDTVDSIALYERTLQDTRNRQGRVVVAFNADIARFKQLKSP